MPTALPDSLHITLGPNANATVVRLAASMPRYARGAAIVAFLAAPYSIANPEQLRLGWDYLSWETWKSLSALGRQEAYGPLLPRHRHKPEIGKIALRHLLRRPESAMMAASIAAPFFQTADRLHARFAKTPTPTVEGRVLQMQEAEESRREGLLQEIRVVPTRIESNFDNIQVRGLRPFLPVIHVAFAVAQAIAHSQAILKAEPVEVQAHFPRDVANNSGRLETQISIGHLLLQSAIQDWVLNRAKALEGLLPLPGFREFPAHTQLRAEWLCR